MKKYLVIILFSAICSLRVTVNAQNELWGMTQNGGANYLGVIFKIDTVNNTYTKVFDFDGTQNGEYPTGSLLQASNELVYGLASEGGANDFGVLFEYNCDSNTFTKKIDFDGVNNGKHPLGDLIQASNEKL